MILLKQVLIISIVYAVSSEIMDCSFGNHEKGMCVNPENCHLPNISSLQNCTNKNGEETKMICCPKKKFSLYRPPNCGKNMYENMTDQRIVGGVVANPGEWPWIVNLGVSFGNGSVGWTCAGAIITNRWILSAAHCFSDPNVQFNIVLVGTHNLFQLDSAAAVGIEKFVVHPEYSEELFHNDISLLKTSEEIEFTNHVRPICLPLEKKMNKITYENHSPYVAGWGSLGFGEESSAVLMQIQVSVVPLDLCRDIFIKEGAHIISSQLCAGMDGEKDACQGDSGGPLMEYDNNKKAFYVIGVVSYGYQCAVKGYPGVYTRVSRYLDWIEQVIESD